MNFYIGGQIRTAALFLFYVTKVQRSLKDPPPCWFLLVILFLWEFDNFDDVQRFLKFLILTHLSPVSSEN